jgi:Rieske Fe-S protein
MLWREEFSIHAAEERYVTRRQFGKFLVLTSLAMFVGNLWILFKSLWYVEPALPATPVLRLGELKVGGVKLFRYPGPNDPCLLFRTGESSYVAYSQKCTHLSCAVFPSSDGRKLECPCHEGYFSMETGRVLQGPPPRPLPKILLEERAGELVAVGIDLGTEES